MKKIISIITLLLSLVFLIDSGNVVNAQTVDSDTVQVQDNQNNVEMAKDSLQKSDTKDETQVINTFVSFITFNNDENVYKERGSDSQLKSIFEGDDSLESYVNDISYGKTKVNTIIDESEDGRINTYAAPKSKEYYMSNNNSNTQGYKRDALEQPKEGMQFIDFNDRTDQEQRQHDLISGALRNIISKYKDKIDQSSGNNKYIFVVPEEEDWSDILWSKVFEDLFDCGIERVAMITVPKSLDDASQLQYEKNVMRHEYLHLLGFPDMYRYINKDIEPVGKWSLMGSTQGVPTVYERMKYGKWIKDDGNAVKEIKDDGQYELSPCTEDPNSNTIAYKIPVPESYDEYFMVEYRKNTSDDGLLVYRVNTAGKEGNAAGPPDEVYVLRDKDISDALIDGVKNESITDFSLSDGTSNLGISISNITKNNNKIKFTLNLRGDNKLETPKNFKAEQIDNQTVNLSWDKNIYYTDYYEVYRDGKLIAKPTVNEYKDENKMEPGETHIYEVKSHSEKFGTIAAGAKVSLEAKDIFTIYDLKAEKSYAVLNQPIKISASAGGGTGKLQYRFYTMWIGHTTEIQPYSEKNEVEWTPTLSVPWEMFVDVKDEAGNVLTKSIQVKVFEDFVIKDFSIKQSTDKDYGQVVNFKAIIEGGSYGKDYDQNYKFYIKNGDKEEVIQESCANTFMWIPKYGGTYTFGVEITDKQTGQVAKQEKDFTITGISKCRAAVSINGNGYENGTWTNKDVNLSLDLEKDDNSDNCVLEYKIDDGEWTRYDGNINFDKDGEYNVISRVNINNGEWYSDEKQYSVKIDKEMPSKSVILGVSNNEERYIGYFICVNSKADNIKSITLDSKPLEDGNIFVDGIGKHSIVVEDEASNKLIYNFTVKELLDENNLTLDNKDQVSMIENDFNKVNSFLSDDKRNKVESQIEKLKSKANELNSNSSEKEDPNKQNPEQGNEGKEDPNKQNPEQGNQGKEDPNKQNPEQGNQGTEDPNKQNSEQKNQGTDDSNKTSEESKKTSDNYTNFLVLLCMMGMSVILIKKYKAIIKG